MSLRERIVVILFIIFCFYAGLEYVAYNRLIYPVFVQQEHQQAQDTAERVLKVIKAEFSDLQDQIAAEARSGVFFPMLKKTPLDTGTLHDRIDFMMLFDYRWNLIQKQMPEQLTPDMIQQTLFRGQTPFLSKHQMGFSKQQIVQFGDQAAFVVAEPILTSPESNVVEGMVLAGQLLTDKRIQSLRKRHHLNFNWDFVTTDDLNNHPPNIMHQITPQNPYCFTPVKAGFLECSTALFDSRNRPVLLLKTFQDKTITTFGKATIDKLILVKLALGFSAILFLTILIQIAIIAPITKLIKHVARFGHPGSSRQKISLSRKDEIGKLATEFEHMCMRLQNAQIKLMEKSYVSGAAEMSSGILHNVRNALSPITTQIERIKDQFQDIPLQNLEQAQIELQTGALSPQRREDLMRFVDLTFQHVLTNLKEMVTELEELSDQVVQIEDMLNARRTFAGRRDKPVEFIEPIQLLNNALEIIPEKFRDKNRIHISRSIKKLPSIPVQPTTFIQILQNLLINASESLEREKPLCPKIAIDCTVESQNSIDMLHWTVQDNGIGIEPDKIETIFERGASSKTQGLTGIGLHWCANTINTMQGRLWAQSAGAHRGAVFHLLVPMAAEEALAQTFNG
jgi:two-component system NtrC family sensor kinase